MDQLRHLIDVDKFKKKYEEMCPKHKYIPAILPKVKRIIVIPDLHGDFDYLVTMLRISKVAVLEANKMKWIGKNTVIVQVGDAIDRCRPSKGKPCSDPKTTVNDEARDVEILRVCTDLHNQAIKEGGMFISLLGNHELMAAEGIMTYVSYMGLEQFRDYKDPKNPDKIFKSGEEARIHAFAPGNELGTFMGCTRLPCIIVGSNLFVHAGIIDRLIDELNVYEKGDLEIINVAIRSWLLGIIDKKYIAEIIKSSPHSMFWTRILGSIPPDVSINDPVCKNNITQVFKLFKVDNIIIGHTPQSFATSDDVNGTCIGDPQSGGYMLGGAVWRVDNGSSQAFDGLFENEEDKRRVAYSRRAQVLEIIDDDKFFIIDEKGRKKANA
jgi:hypothetical protein